MNKYIGAKIESHLFRNQWDECVHPVVGELQCDLDEGVRTGAALLDQPLPEVSEGDDVTVHVIRQTLGYRQGALDGFLALEEETVVC